MPAQQIDRKIRWLLAFIAVMVLALPVLAVRSYIARVSESKILASAGPTDERLVDVDGRSMLVPPEALGRTMVEWLKSRKDKTFSFEFSDRSFVVGSAAPSPITLQRIHQVVQLARMSRTLMVRILLPTHLARGAALQLDEQRAASFRNALTANGVSSSHVTISAEQQGLPMEGSPYLAVQLSK